MMNIPSFDGSPSRTAIFPPFWKMGGRSTHLIASGATILCSAAGAVAAAPWAPAIPARAQIMNPARPIGLSIADPLIVCAYRNTDAGRRDGAILTSSTQEDGDARLLRCHDPPPRRAGSHRPGALALRRQLEVGLRDDGRWAGAGPLP